MFSLWKGSAMRSKFRLLSTFFFLLILQIDSFAQNGTSPTMGTRYQGLRTWQEQAWSAAQTHQEKMEVLRETVRRRTLLRRSPVGENVQQLPGELFVRSGSSRAQDGRSITRLRQQERHLRQCEDVALRGRNKRRREVRLTGLNRPTTSLSGKTDLDIEFRHRATGTNGRIEVKEMRLETQHRNLRSLEIQFRKMAEDRRTTGRIQVWVNRRKNIQEIEACGRKYGIPVYGDVATGRAALRPGQPSLRAVLDHIDRHASMTTSMAGGAQLGFGLYQLVLSGDQTWDDMQAILDDDRDDAASLGRLGQHLSMTVAGALFSVSGSAKVTRSLGYASKLAGLSRWAGRLGVGATLAAGGFVLWQYQSGQLTDRAFTRVSVPLAGGVVLGVGGAWSGMWVGASIGSAFGPVGTAIGGTIGGLAGGFGGGWLGSSLSSRWLEDRYSLNDQQMEAERVRFLYSLYGVK